MQDEQFKSDEERYISWFLIELQESGYVNEFRYEPKVFHLSEPTLTNDKNRRAPIQVHSGIDYIPDFHVIWTEKAKGIFIASDQSQYWFGERFPFISKDMEGWIDVKGSFSGGISNTSAVTFPIKRSWLFQRYGIYAQKIIPIKSGLKKHSGLFPETFTPKRYLLTTSGKKGRKINHQVVSLAVYVDRMVNFDPNEIVKKPKRKR